MNVSLYALIGDLLVVTIELYLLNNKKYKANITTVVNINAPITWGLITPASLVNINKFNASANAIGAIAWTPFNLNNTTRAATTTATTIAEEIRTNVLVLRASTSLTLLSCTMSNS